MGALAGHIDQLVAGFGRFLGADSAPWILLLVLLLIRLPGLGEIRQARKIAHTRRYRHLLNLTRFRTELVKRAPPDSGVRVGPR